MVYIDFEIFNLRDITGRFAGLSERAQSRAEPLVSEALQILYKAMYEKAPRSKYAAERGLVPGQRLAANIEIIPVHVENGRLSGGVVLPDVAIFTIPPGTRRHEIRPRFKKWLRYFQGGQWRFARVVNHPGYQPPTDWTLDAFNSVEADIQRLLYNAGDYLIRTGA